MHDPNVPLAPAAANRFALFLLCAVIVLYVIGLLVGWPQSATERIVAGAEQQEHPPEAPDHGLEDDAHGAEAHAAAEPPALYTVIPFALLLGAIAVLPLVPATAHWWERNQNRFLVSAGLAALTLGYYLFVRDSAIERHFVEHAVVPAAESGPSWQITWTVIQNALFSEYIPFIVLLFSLFTITGGIRIQGDLRAHPLTNTTFMAIGGLLASFIGTTGAAMLLIRPLLETNRERQHVAHTVVFFIFIVCNCGGCLTPLGDPPLFLGYLQGVDFLWTFRLWPEWLFVNCALLATYFLWDQFYSYPRESPTDVLRDERQVTRLTISGLGVNGPLLVLLILAVALLAPSKAIPGTDWHPWLFLRETAQLSLVALSLTLGSLAIRAANRFNYDAIIEVAALFFGIFICMQPALQILDARGAQLGLDSPREFFWVTGLLSAVLDNAPTYLVFFQTARSLPSTGAPEVAGVAEPLLVAISLGAVFMGAMTYIGNGPNFMVKAIAETNRVRMPTFFGYCLYSCLVLLPILVIMTLLFF